MKKCEYCGEKIQDTAKKCKHCGEWLDENSKSDENSNKKDITKNNSNINLSINEEFFTLEELKNKNVKIGYYPWRRYFAKTFDISIYITITGLLIFLTSGGVYGIENGIYEIANKGELSNGGKLFFLLFFSYILIEPIFISSFSTTLGKQIMGIKVFGINKEKLSYKDGFLRTLMMYIKGIALGFPIISQIVMLTQYSNLISKGTGYNTSYDENKYLVLYKKVGFLSYILIIFLIISLSFIPYSNSAENNVETYKKVAKYEQNLSKKDYEYIFYKELIKNENSFNELLPNMITDDIRLDKILLPGNNSFQYNYTYVNISKSEININNTITNLKSEIINGIIDSSDLKSFREHNIKFIYSYKDKNGNSLFDINILPEDYNNYSIDFSNI